MSVLTIQTVGGEDLARVNRILAGIPGGAFKAASSALRRAGDTGKTRAGQYAAAAYTISKGTFMQNVTEKTAVSGWSGGVAEMRISFAGQVLPLLRFRTRFGRDGLVQTQVLRTGGPSALQRAFAARALGRSAIFERLGDSRLPIEEKFGPSTAHMMQNPQVVEKMTKTIEDTFAGRLDHEILRVLNGWGGNP